MLTHWLRSKDEGGWLWGKMSMADTAMGIMREHERKTQRGPQDNFRVGKVLSDTYEVFGSQFAPLVLILMVVGLPVVLLSALFMLSDLVMSLIFGSGYELDRHLLHSYFPMVHAIVTAIQEILLYPIAALFVTKIALRSLWGKRALDELKIGSRQFATAFAVGVMLYLIYGPLVYGLHYATQYLTPWFWGDAQSLLYTMQVTVAASRAVEMLIFAAFLVVAVPVCIARDTPASESLSESSRLTSGRRGTIVRAIFATAAVIAVASFAATTLQQFFFWRGGYSMFGSLISVWFTFMRLILTSVCYAFLFTIPAVIYHQLTQPGEDAQAETR